MRIGVVGAGYVGLVAGVCLAEMGNAVMVVDNDPVKIETLQSGRTPHYEPGLDELRMRNQLNRRLSFSTSIPEMVRQAEVIFVAVGTPIADNGFVDMSALDAAVSEIAAALDGYRLIVVKSTVPPGTNHRLAGLIQARTAQPFDLASNPEFLKEGTAVNDFMHPDRVIIGARTEKAYGLMRSVYNPFFRTGYRLMETDPESAEMIKYSSNVMLAARISLMNEISRICHAVGADVEKVRIGVGLDRRIGSSFLFAGLGYGGSCFPKDVQAMAYLAEQSGIESGMCRAIDTANLKQREILLPFITKEFGSDCTGLDFALLGLAYKPRTDDVRESPALVLAGHLLEMGARVRGFDPEAGENAKRALPGLALAEGIEEALTGVDALFICTEWNEFRTLDWERLRDIMKRPLVFDGRNLYYPEEMAERGFTYYSVGRRPAEPGGEKKKPGISVRIK